MAETCHRKIVFWNAAGITSKKRELKHFLAEEDVALMLIWETWLEYNLRLKIYNYQINRNDVKAQQGNAGTAILIKRSILYTSKPSFKSSIEHTIVEVYFLNQKVTSAYKPREPPITQLDLQSLFSQQQKTIDS